MSKFTKGNNLKNFFLKCSPGNLLIIYELTMFEAASYKNFRDILITSFPCPNLQRAITQKIYNNLLKKKSPGNLLTIFCQLTMFDAASYNNFRDILNTSFQCPTLQRAITKKNSPDNLLIILYQLTKFEATSCYSI